MRRRDHAHVDRDRLRRADGPHFAFLQHAQQLDLQGERHVADLVEEDRPAVGRLEQPLVRLDRAGERAARVPEQLGLEQRLRESRRSSPRRTACRAAGSPGGSRGRPAPCRCRSRRR